MHSLWFGRLKARLDEKRADKAKWLIEGGPQDYPSYRFDVGYLQGLADALTEANEVDAEQLGISPNVARSPHEGR
jgi:hypothetical protein